MTLSTKGLPLDVRLSAWLDGELDATETAEIDALLKTDAAARELLDKLKRGSALGLEAFAEQLKEPVPLALVRKIKAAEIKKKPAKPMMTSFSAFRPAGKPNSQAMVASIAFLVVGGLAGYLIGSSSGAFTQAPIQVASADRSWLDDIAAYHRIYSREDKHLVELPASDKTGIETWLSKSVDVPFSVPDLAADGLTFQGARLLVAAEKPVAQLLYKDKDGQIIAICFMNKPGTVNGDSFVTNVKDDIALVSWQRGTDAFVVVGPATLTTLQAIAKTTATSI